jgi:uncharacterized protein (DUF3820 family)
MSDENDPILPFGKHKGEHCSDVPVGYLDWLIGQDWLRPEMKEQIEAHLETRPEWKRMGDDD